MDRPVALITGGTRGIGLGISKALSEEGFALCLNGVRPVERVKEVLEELKQRTLVHYVPADVGEERGRERIIEECKGAFGRLDVLVNNAGIAPLVRADLLETEEESFDRVLSVNLKGPYFLSQKASHWLIEERKRDPERFLCIINISSISAYTASTNRGEYCVAKAGLSMVTKLFAVRLAPFRINVYEIRPGIVETDMTAPVREKYEALIGQGLYPIKRWGKPEDVGKAVACVARGSLPFSTGAVIDVDGGFHLKWL